MPDSWPHWWGALRVHPSDRIPVPNRAAKRAEARGRGRVDRPASPVLSAPGRRQFSARRR